MFDRWELEIELTDTTNRCDLYIVWSTQNTGIFINVYKILFL